MARASMAYKELRFLVEDEATRAYVYIEAHGDCPLGVQGWHHKVFPSSVTVQEAVGLTRDAVAWPLEAPRQNPHILSSRKTSSEITIPIGAARVLLALIDEIEANEPLEEHRLIDSECQQVREWAKRVLGCPQ